MADTATAQVEQPAAPQTPAAAPTNDRAARRASAIANLQATRATAAVAPAAEAPKPAAAAPTAPAKPAEAASEKLDPAAERGLRAVEQAKKKHLDEVNSAKAELEVQRAEIAKLRKDAEGRLASREELKKLKPTELLDSLDHYGEDELDILSRAAYARTKAGKADPRAQQAAQEASRAQGGKAAQAEVAELRETVRQLEAKLTGEFTRRDQRAYAEHWVGEAAKAVPADKPTFLARQLAAEPESARRELLVIGAELEKANDGEPPTHAEVIAEFETRKRAQLKSLGLDPDALLAPPKPAAPVAPAKPATRTLDPGAAGVTRAENAPKSRDERREAAIAKLKASRTMTADQH